jgi:bile acid-coenzyme A ligase
MSGIDPRACVDAETGQPIAGTPLGTLLSAHAALTPDRPAVTFGEATTTYAALDAAANRRARQLAALGVGQDDRVAIALPNSLAFLECAFAVWKVGATVCPISEKLTASEFAAIIELMQPAAVLVNDRGRWDGSGAVLVQGPSPAALPDAPLSPKAARRGRILPSGGSTGRPKLIVDPYPSAWGPEKAGFRRPLDATLLIASPLCHSGPFSAALYALAQGSHVVGMERFEPMPWLAAIARHRADYVYAVPTMMTRIMKLDPAITAGADLSSIDTLLHMAAPCPPETKRWWIDRLGRPEKVLEVYGGTERIGLTTIDGAEWLRRPGSVGKPIPGDEAVIVDDAGATLPPGEIGEVRFRKTNRSAPTYAYIGSATRISGGLDSYGDMGWMDGDGYLYIADRRTDMVLLGGVNVYPAEIEAVIDSLPGVLGSAVIGLPDGDMGNRLHAIVELDAGLARPDPDVFAAGLREQLSGLKCPRSFEFTTERIRDDAGKVRRSALREARLRDPTSGGTPR